MLLETTKCHGYVIEIYKSENDKYFAVSTFASDDREITQLSDSLETVRLSIFSLAAQSVNQADLNTAEAEEIKGILSQYNIFADDPDDFEDLSEFPDPIEEVLERDESVQTSPTSTPSTADEEQKA